MWVWEAQILIWSVRWLVGDTNLTYQLHNNNWIGSGVNDEFSTRYVEFQVSSRHVNKDVQKAVEYMNHRMKI